MIRSIRYFLLISILLSITIASAINGVGNYLLDEHVIQPYLDRQLIRISILIDLLSKSNPENQQFKGAVTTYLHNIRSSSHDRFIFQIWDKNGSLVLASDDKSFISLKNTKLGFSDKEIAGDDWRVYTAYDPNLQTRIVVAELYDLRRELADDIARSNANILLITYPLFGLVVWFIISFALKSITRVTTEISNRASTFLEPVQLSEIPTEIKPLVAELNQLFIRLKLAFDRNKRFSADAAHELRTPLAALKTNLQVALKATDAWERDKALDKVLICVDRSSHIVTQLLTLSRLGEEEPLLDVKPVDLHKLAIEIIAYLAPHAIEKNIEIELLSPPPSSMVLGNDISLGILIRNIVDNAIRYTPENGDVIVKIIEKENEVIFRVTDTGPGIPPALRERVFERFYRILGTKASGSGLGLAIVLQISALHRARVSLGTPQNGTGLQFDVAFPKFHA